MSTSKQTNHLTINLLENDDILKYLVEHNMTNEGELYLVEGESDYAQSDWGVTDSADPAYILNKPDLSIYATEDWVENKGYLTSHQDISGKLDTDGDASNVTAAFTAQASRQALTTGEKLSSLFGKIAKWLTDLKSVAFSGSYNDLSDTPQIPTVTNDLTDTLKQFYDIAYEHSQSDHAPVNAEENVQSNWNETNTSSDAYILNKPDLSVYATQTWVEGKSYLTSHQDISGKLDKTGDGSNVTATFTVATTRTALTSGTKLSDIFGSVAKWLSDLNTVAFTGSYNDLSDTPQIPIVTNDLTDALKANYDAAYSHSTSDHAPSTAEENVQSDWNVTDETSDAFILNKPSSLPANGGNADTVDDKHASDFALATDITDMATQTWVGQQGYVTSSEGEIVDPVPEYATTEYIASLDHVTRTEMLTEIERQIQGAINASY